MSRYVVHRVLVSLLLIWLVLTLTFVLLHLAPGDPVDRFLDPRLPRDQAERIGVLYGFDQPIGHRYLSWLRALALEGELGTSFLFKRPVTSVLAEHLPPTVILGAAALGVQYLLGILLGVLAAARSNHWPDHLVRFATAVMYALPTFWIGLMSILLFSQLAGALPPGGMTSPFSASWSTGQKLLDLLHHLVLPALVLGVPLSAQVARLVRNGLLEEMTQDYVRSARARGLAPIRVFSHALWNASAPLVQLAGLSVPLLLGGAVIVEHVFSWPGLGSVTISAIAARDYPLVLGTTILTSVAVVFGNLAADITQATIDPRVRLR